MVASQASTRQEAAARCKQSPQQRRQCLGLAAPGADLRFTLRNFCPCRHQQALARSLHQHFKLLPTPRQREHRAVVKTLAWQDLRLHDNETLVAAARAAKASVGQLAFVYVHSPDEDGDDPATGVWAQH